MRGVKEGEATQDEGRWLVQRRIPSRHARVTKGHLWNSYGRCNYFKFTAQVFRRCISRTKWEREWSRFVYRNWNQDTLIHDFTARCLIYSATRLFCIDEYIGETEATLDGRIRTHDQNAVGQNRRQPGGIDTLNEEIHSVI